MTEAVIDYSGFVRQEPDGKNSLVLAVDGMHCASCAFRIEKTLNANENVQARVNLTRQRLKILWSGYKE